MVWSTDADDAKMLLGILFPMSQAIIDQLALNTAQICLDNTLKILCKSLPCFYVQIQNSISRSVSIQVIPGNLQKYVSTSGGPLQCKTLPAHFSNNMMVYCSLKVQMKWFFIAEFERTAKIRKIAV